ncbi:hypothetical protein [Halobacillus mangrovi]|uniref:DUF2157 domain-containing protein n=1 Tax=Halobacillus mangrovi TaxID=402384 RepID=A0A1W6A059_9BACI|nr:hypothetical protein [Halobacillus mangrovi]ARI78958.1 hypothetical protein HM131_19950 [Halobacillus mangrovi]
MSHLSEEKKQEILKDKLIQLWSNGYLSEEEYMKVVEANRSFIEDRDHKKRNVEEGKKDEVIQVAAEPLQTKSKEPAKTPKKKVKTAEQIRERNITWSLIIGVSLLLITGLIVATSQWDQMGAGLKVFSISFVSLFFLGLSYITGRFLKITQTAFAFLTLGSLLIPIVILAIGYFDLFGSYLSLFGEGKYLLGLLGTLIPLPLYIRNAYAHSSRLYVWISLVFLSLAVGFALGALPLNVDAFYLMLMIYNASLLLVYVRFKDSKRWQLFLKEVPLYAQLNLVLSTVLLLFFFESGVFYSFNLLLTASIYMAMVFVYKTKEYQFVFSVMVVYAVYQLVEHSPLQSVDVTVYAVVGLIYLGFANVFKNHRFIEKVFRYTSGVVSFFAFIYISYESIALRGEEGSWFLLAAYGIITANYLILSNLTKHPVFAYMSPVFFFVTLWQLWELTKSGPLFLFMFIGASVLLVYVGLLTKQRSLKSVQDSSFYVSVFVLIACIAYSLNELFYGYSSLMFLIIAILAYLVKRKTVSKDIKETTYWIQPVTLCLSAVLFYNPLVNLYPSYEEGLALPFHLAVAGISLLAIHYGWVRFKEKGLAKSTFYVGQGTYILAMILLLNNAQIDPVVIRPLLLFVGIGMMGGLVQYSKERLLWVLVSIVTLSFYTSLLDTFAFETFSSFVIYMSFAPVLLILIGEIGEKNRLELRPYFYGTAHILLPLIIAAIMLDQINVPTIHPLVLCVPLSLYGFSTFLAKREWEIKLMLYGFLTVLFFLISTLPSYYRWWTTVPNEYAFYLTSIVITGIWGAAPYVWKRRMEWYAIPFSILGLFLLITRFEDIPTIELLPILSYVCLIQFFLHRREWSLVRFIPLLMMIDLLEKVSNGWEHELLIIALVGCIVTLLAAGRFFHRLLIGSGVKVDAYSWTALVYLFYLNTVTAMDENVWIRIIPVLLAGLWFFLNASKWPQPLGNKIFYTAGVISLYTSYSLVLLDYREWIPDLIEAELQVLPVLVILSFLRGRKWKEYPYMMNHIQFGVVLLVAAYLVIDAIQSHTIWDAWMIGGLSLISMILGMQFRIKSYFFVGMGVLIFNVIYQTRPYWGNVPWWVYLLLAGLLLIGIASYNEWQKQRSVSEKPVERKLKRLWLSLKKWN